MVEEGLAWLILDKFSREAEGDKGLSLKGKEAMKEWYSLDKLGQLDSLKGHSLILGFGYHLDDIHGLRFHFTLFHRKEEFIFLGILDIRIF